MGPADSALIVASLAFLAASVSTAGFLLYRFVKAFIEFFFRRP